MAVGVVRIKGVVHHRQTRLGGRACIQPGVEHDGDMCEAAVLAGRSSVCWETPAD